MQFARRVHSNTTLKGGEGRMEIEYLKTNKKKKQQTNKQTKQKQKQMYNKLNLYKCPNYFANFGLN